MYNQLFGSGCGMNVRGHNTHNQLFQSSCRFNVKGNNIHVVLISYVSVVHRLNVKVITFMLSL